MFVCIYDPPLFRQCDITDNAYIEKDSRKTGHPIRQAVFVSCYKFLLMQLLNVNQLLLI